MKVCQAELARLIISALAICITPGRPARQGSNFPAHKKFRARPVPSRISRVHLPRSGATFLTLRPFRWHGKSRFKVIAGRVALR